MRWVAALLILGVVGEFSNSAEAKNGGFDVGLQSRWWQTEGRRVSCKFAY